MTKQQQKPVLTVWIVCAFRGGPVAVYLSPEKAHADVLKRPGKFNNWEIEEIEVSQ